MDYKSSVWEDLLIVGFLVLCGILGAALSNEPPTRTVPRVEVFQ